MSLTLASMDIWDPEGTVWDFSEKECHVILVVCKWYVINVGNFYHHYFTVIIQTFLIHDG